MEEKVMMFKGMKKYAVVSLFTRRGGIKKE
jgi:hypothetical protein